MSAVVQDPAFTAGDLYGTVVASNALVSMQAITTGSVVLSPSSVASSGASGGVGGLGGFFPPSPSADSVAKAVVCGSLSEHPAPKQTTASPAMLTKLDSANKDLIIAPPRRAQSNPCTS